MAGLRAPGRIDLIARRQLGLTAPVPGQVAPMDLPPNAVMAEARPASFGSAAVILTAAFFIADGCGNPQTARPCLGPSVLRQKYGSAQSPDPDHLCGCARGDMDRGGVRAAGLPATVPLQRILFRAQHQQRLIVEVGAEPRGNFRPQPAPAGDERACRFLLRGSVGNCRSGHGGAADR